MQDTLFRTGMTILDERGQYEQRDGLRISLVYEDEHIHIEAIMPMESGGSIDSFFINLKMPPREHPTQPFGIPKTPLDQETPVLVWKGIPRYYRPGRWEKYLKQLLDDIRKEDTEVEALNGMPIDDSDLFPDIADDKA